MQKIILATSVAGASYLITKSGILDQALKAANSIKNLVFSQEVDTKSPTTNPGVTKTMTLGTGVKQNYNAAVKSYEQAAKQGHAVAQNNLGNMYKEGLGVEQDYQEAVKFYKQAAKQGNADAQNNLGTMYIKGLGVEQDYQEAVKFYKQAAKQGDADAQNKLGIMYQAGLV